MPKVAGTDAPASAATGAPEGKAQPHGATAVHPFHGPTTAGASTAAEPKAELKSEPATLKAAAATLLPSIPGDAGPVPAASLPSASGAEPAADKDAALPAQPAPTDVLPTPVPQGTTPTTPAAAATPTQTAAPAQQVAAALVHLTRSASGSSMTLRLDPGDLGRVQVRIDRGLDGTATVHVAAERPETLRLLVADQTTLHRTLDGAGVPQDGRNLNFSLSTSDSDRGSSGAFSGGGFNGGSNANAGGGQQGGSARQDRSAYPAAIAASLPKAAWLRAGVDITA